MSDHGRGGEASYGRSDFESIVTRLDVNGYASAAFGIGPNRIFKINAQGVWIEPDSSDGAPRWHPKSETRLHGGGNPYDEPLLPFPFTAKQLAAFMVDGYGEMFLRLEFGEWEDGPDIGADYPTLRLPASAREVMDEAYAAFRVAAKGAEHLLPQDVRRLESVHVAAKAKLRRFERRNEQDAENPEHFERKRCVDNAKSELENARAQDTDISRMWRKAVVTHLLMPRLAQSMSSTTESPPLPESIVVAPLSARYGNRSRIRSDVLAPLVEVAIKNALDPADRTAAWNELTAMASAPVKVHLLAPTAN